MDSSRLKNPIDCVLGNFSIINFNSIDKMEELGLLVSYMVKSETFL